MNEQKESTGLKGFVNIKHFSKDGTLLNERNGPNTVVNGGFARVASLLGGQGGNSFGYIAVGTGVVASGYTDTALGTEITDSGLARAAATISLVTVNVTNDTAQFVKSFSVTGSKAVTESGIFDAASSGTMLCRQVFSAINVANGDTLQITWKITVTHP